MRQLLVPYDGSPLADAAACVARRLARRVARVQARVQARVERHQRVPQPDDVWPPRAPWADLVPDLLVLAAPAGEGRPRPLEGLAALEVARRSRAPVLVCPVALRAGPDGTSRVVATPRVRHVVVAVDGSSSSAAILPPALALAEATDARLTLLHVKPSVDARWTAGAPGGRTSDLGAVRRLDERCVEVHAVTGSPLPALLVRTTCALGGDVLALALHDGWWGPLGGGVAEATLREARRPCLPVLLARAGGSNAAAAPAHA